MTTPNDAPVPLTDEDLVHRFNEVTARYSQNVVQNLTGVSQSSVSRYRLGNWQWLSSKNRYAMRAFVEGGRPVHAAYVRLDDRLANEAMRIADGLEPREHCATLLCDAVEALRAQDRALAEARELIQEKLLGSHGMPGQWRRDARRWLAAHEQETTP